MYVGAREKRTNLNFPDVHRLSALQICRLFKLSTVQTVKLRKRTLDISNSKLQSFLEVPLKLSNVWDASFYEIQDQGRLGEERMEGHCLSELAGQGLLCWPR